MNTGNAQVVDLAFSLRGTSVPADHGYALYSALCHRLPWLHDATDVGVHAIRGQLTGQRRLTLTQSSRLVLRLPASSIPTALPLAGMRLEVDGDAVRVGVPSVRALQPDQSLVSRLVVIKGFMDPTSFLAAAERQIAAMGVTGTATLLSRTAGHSFEGGKGGSEGIVRRTVRIHQREVVGFALRIDGLSSEDSVRVQGDGLGGRRRFGCGIFLGSRQPSDAP